MLTSALRRSCVVLLESSGGNLSTSSRVALSALSALPSSSSLHSAVLLADKDAPGISTAAAFGWGKLTVIPLRSSPEFTSRVIADLAGESSEHTHILSAHSAVGRAVIPRVAALMDTACVSDVTKILDADTFQRPIYAGNAVTTVKVNKSSSPTCVTVRNTAFSPAVDPASPVQGCRPEFKEDKFTDPQSTHVSEEMAVSARPSLQSASAVISGGRALGSEEKFNSLLDPLADVLGAAVGASRAAVDAGYAGNSLQVGQTGKQVAPELYIAIGISGAIQHISGMKDSKLIVAINKDAEAPIFKCADVGLVGDLFTIIPELVTELKAVKAAA